MSPIDPISPTSPMEYSPTTPVSMDQKQFMLPVPASSSQSVNLPKLVTSFQNATSSLNDVRRMSVQFQLSTPSPLSLRQTPLTAVQRRASVPWHKRSDAVSANADINRRDKNFRSLADLLSTPLGEFPSPDSSSSASFATRRPPALRRENANEGMNGMAEGTNSPIIEQVINLPLRIARSSGESVLQRSRVTTSPMQQMCAQIQLTDPVGKAKTAHLVEKCKSRRPGSRVQPRSPIHKHKRRNDILQPATDRCPKLHIRKPQTKQQQILHEAIEYYSSRLVPLISLTNGQPHPDFPRNLLQYHLLTHEQLDSLARWYHQTLDGGELRWKYPCPLQYGKVWCGSTQAMNSSYDYEKKQLVDLVTKRRRWGRFIGLQRCESPDEDSSSVTARMDKEMREALRKAEEDARLREKLWGRRFG